MVTCSPHDKLLYEVWSARTCVGLGYDAHVLAKRRDAMALLQAGISWGIRPAWCASLAILLCTIWASRVYGRMAHLFVAGRLCEDVSEQLNRLPCEVTPL